MLQFGERETVELAFVVELTIQKRIIFRRVAAQQEFKLGRCQICRRSNKRVAGWPAWEKPGQSVAASVFGGAETATWANSRANPHNNKRPTPLIQICRSEFLTVYLGQNVCLVVAGTVGRQLFGTPIFGHYYLCPTVPLFFDPLPTMSDDECELCVIWCS